MRSDNTCSFLKYQEILALFRPKAGQDVRTLLERAGIVPVDKDKVGSCFVEPQSDTLSRKITTSRKGYAKP